MNSVGPEEVAAVGQVAGWLVELGALVDAALDEFGDLLELGLRIDRADVRVLVERVADADRREPVLELVDERLGDRLLDEQARARAADLALVEVDAVDDALDRLVERRVIEDDVGGLAAELEREALVGPGHALGDEPADLGGAREGDLVDARWVTSDIPTAPGPGTMLTTPGGRSAWRQTSANRSAVSGVVDAGLRTTVLPAARAGAIFQASISSGKFHGMIWAATPSGCAVRPGNAYSSLSAQPA